jgi:hypothetical protein
MSEKVVLTKKVADALEMARKRGDEEVIEVIFDSENSYVSEETKILNALDRMDLVRALMNGYEVEETPGDRVRAYYENLDMKDLRGVSYYELTGEKRGIRKTLNLLDLKIEGVNHK